MKHLLMIAFGGALGAVSRYSLSTVVNSIVHQKFSQGHFPFATLTVNVLGSFFIGIMYVVIVENASIHQDWRNVAMVGFLGAFTTFSTFSLESITLLENGQILSAVSYILSSVVFCILAAWIAIFMTRLI